MSRRFAFPSLLLVLLAVPFGTASATSFVLASDESLVDQASAVVEVRVVSRDDAPAALRSGLPATDYMIEVEGLVKGRVPGSTLILRVPGGVRPDGLGFKVWGAPEFQVGERALLFLHPNQDGTFSSLHLMQGAFHEVEAGRRRLAVRDLHEAQEVELPGTGAPPAQRERLRGPRDLDRFTAWISDRGRGSRRGADYFVQLSDAEKSAIASRFTLFTSSSDGSKLRWFFFDEEAASSFVGWRVLASGQPGLSMAQVIQATKDGAAAWTKVAGTNIRYNYIGTTDHINGLSDPTDPPRPDRGPDGINSIIFEDPYSSSDFGGAFSCGFAGGGTLAIGGPWFFSNTRAYKGQQYHEIAEGDIITNKGLGCYFDASAHKEKDAAELFGHELGHTLGIGHSSESSSEPNALLRDALMYFAIHGDGRGARLNSDDIAAARALYAVAAAKPKAPTDLAATAVSATSISLTWTDNAQDETSFEVQMKPAGGSYQTVGNPPADSTSFSVSDLSPQATYTFRVRARNSGGASAFSNEASATTPAAVPAAPTDLEATPLSTTSIELHWHDAANNETGFSIEVASPLADYQEVGTAPADSESFVVANLQVGMPYSFRVRAGNAQGSSDYSDEASATTKRPDANNPCVASAEDLCLLGDRFRVSVRWHNQNEPGHADTGAGQAVPVPGSDVTGRFYFFQPSNIELIVKMIDGRSITGHFWVFSGALSNLEYWITVEDTAGDRSRTYHNPPGGLLSLTDTQALEALGQNPQPGASTAAARLTSAPSVPLSGSLPGAVSRAGSGGTCTAGPTTLCLLDDRIQVQVLWDNSQRMPGDTGLATVDTALTTRESGTLWFFSPDNLELAVKVIDGRTLTGAFWVFLGGLSDVQYTVTVTDTVSGTSRPFTKAFGHAESSADINFLPVAPDPQ